MYCIIVVLHITQRANDFLHNYETGNANAVNVLLDSRNKKVIKYNRKRLVPIVKTIIFCVRNNLALRGHREIGSMKDDETKNNFLSGEQGIFRALLSFRIESGDSDLLSHFETSNKNSTMVSPTIQNEIIEVIRLVIKKKKLLKELKILNCIQYFVMKPQILVQ